MLRLLQVDERGHILNRKKRALILNKWRSPPSVYFNNNRQYDRPKIFRELQENVTKTIGILRDAFGNDKAKSARELAPLL